MNEIHRNFARVALKETLLKCTLAIKFKKVNGEERLMNCTLSPDIVPVIKKDPSTETKYSDNVMRVWDVDLKAWRSFIIDNILEVTHPTVGVINFNVENL